MRRVASRLPPSPSRTGCFHPWLALSRCPGGLRRARWFRVSVPSTGALPSVRCLCASRMCMDMDMPHGY